jgi:hypothetical protein
MQKEAMLFFRKMVDLQLILNNLSIYAKSDMHHDRVLLVATNTGTERLVAVKKRLS